MPLAWQRAVYRNVSCPEKLARIRDQSAVIQPSRRQYAAADLMASRGDVPRGPRPGQPIAR